MNANAYQHYTIIYESLVKEGFYDKEVNYFLLGFREDLAKDVEQAIEKITSAIGLEAKRLPKLQGRVHLLIFLTETPFVHFSSDKTLFLLFKKFAHMDYQRSDEETFLEIETIFKENNPTEYVISNLGKNKNILSKLVVVNPSDIKEDLFPFLTDRVAFLSILTSAVDDSITDRMTTTSFTQLESGQGDLSNLPSRLTEEDIRFGQAAYEYYRQQTNKLRIDSKKIASGFCKGS